MAVEEALCIQQQQYEESNDNNNNDVDDRCDFDRRENRARQPAHFLVRRAR